MQPRDLNLTTEITGYQRYLFLGIPAERQEAELASRIDHLCEGMVNLHDITGQPSADDLERGCRQLHSRTRHFDTTAGPSPLRRMLGKGLASSSILRRTRSLPIMG